jgi:hypothetical protein
LGHSRDFEERGEDPDLGKQRDPTTAPPPIIDVAQGVLWRAEHRPSELAAYLVQALAGKGLRSGAADSKPPEAAAAERLLGAWRRLVDDNLLRQR